MKALQVAALVMAAAVVLGAFGAHGLRATLEAADRMGVWQTAVLYHALHGLALMALGIWQIVDAQARESSALRFAGWAWGAGIVAFSGSLYALSLGGPGWLGPVTPLGGLAFIAGWLALALAAFRRAKVAPGA